MHDALLTLLLLLTLVSIVSIATPRLNVPPPIVLVFVGLLVAVIPGIPRPRLEPGMILVFFLPPLLYADAFHTSWVDFKRYIRPIALLAVGLVAVTILVVGLVTKWLFPDMPWAACFILGAVLSPTDMVAAQAILSRLHIPRKGSAILGAESLVNDATGLVGVQIGVAVALSGAFHATDVAWRFTIVAGGGIAIGIAAGLVFAFLNRFVRDNTALFALSLVAPYSSYLCAEHFGASGVLAVVATAFLVAWRIHQIPAVGRVRLFGAGQLIGSLLNGFCFLYIGLEVPRLLAAHSSADLASYGLRAGLIGLSVIVTRFAWVFPAAYLPLVLSPKTREREGGYPSWRAVLVAGWCGMRGALSLAAALSIPTVLDDGSPFVGRDVIELCTLTTIAATLLLQGLTLGPLIKLLKIPADVQGAHEARVARVAALTAGIARLDEYRARASRPDAVHRLRESMVDHLQALEARDVAAREIARRRSDVDFEVKDAVLAAETAALLRLRDAGAISEETYLDLQIEFDTSTEG